MMTKAQKEDQHRRIEVGRRAVEALEAGEDAGELDLKQTLLSLSKVVDPLPVVKETVSFGAELVKVALGKSDIAPDKRDWRFKDEAWESNPVFKRLCQSYLAFCKGANGILGSGADWRTHERPKFALDVATNALAPTNNLLGNPATLRKAVDTKGMSLAGESEISCLTFATMAACQHWSMPT
jgi:polyhydroxyalkanoate synthase